MTLYKRILVPLDGTPVDDAVLDQVEGLAALTGAEVVLLRVAHYHTRDTMAHEVEDAQACLERTEGRLARRGIATRTLVGRGEPADVIIAQVAEQRPDLVAMATHGHGTMQRVVYGSVADKVRHHITVPLLLVKAGGGGGRA